MISFNSIEKQCNYPKAYYIFYKYFLKATVRELKWKEALMHERKMFASPMTKAFALVMLDNSYQAWLFYYKSKNYGLISEYDENILDNCDTILECIIPNHQLNVNNTSMKNIVKKGEYGYDLLLNNQKQIEMEIQKVAQNDNEFTNKLECFVRMEQENWENIDTKQLKKEKKEIQVQIKNTQGRSQIIQEAKVGMMKHL